MDPFDVHGRDERSAVPMVRNNRCTACGVDFPLGTLLCPDDGTLLAAEIEAELGTSYKLRGLIGQGGMAVVIKADHVLLNRPVAIKMLRSHLLFSDKAVERFHREAKTISALEHPNIVHIYDFNVSSRVHPYLVMEFIEGGSLEEKIWAKRRLTVKQAMPLFKQICAALAHVHAKGILHRDVKPSNVLIAFDKNGFELVKLVDFGLAKLSEPDESSRRLTATGDVKGSPLYMSPEQCQARDMTPASDIYSFGCLMYEALTGVPPFSGENALHTMYLHSNENAPPMSQPDVVVGQGLQEIIFKCLEKDPRRRYKSAKDLLIDLVKFENGTYRCSLVPLSSIRSIVPYAKNGLPLLVVLICVAFSAWTLRPRPAVEHLSTGDKYVKDHLSSWKNAQRLSLAGLTVTDVGVKYLEQLPSIKALDLERTKIGDEALETLTHMPALEIVNISETAVSDKGLSKLSRLRSLRSLIVDKCAITDAGLSALATLPYLHQLDAQYCLLAVDRLLLPSHLRNLTIGQQRCDVKWGETACNNLASLVSLQELYLNGEHIPLNALKVICALPQLKKVNFRESLLIDCLKLDSASIVNINLESADFNQSVLESLPQNLICLNLKGTRLRDGDVLSLEGLKELTYLDIGYTRITDSCIEHLLSLKKLTHLNLSADNVSTRAVEELSALPVLSELALYGTEVDDRALVTIGQMKQMTDLDLASTAVTAEGLKHLTSLTNLRRLQLNGTHLAPSSLEQLSDLPQLEVLTLSLSTVFSGDGSLDESAVEMLKRFRSLHRLELGGLTPEQKLKISPRIHCRVSASDSG